MDKRLYLPVIVLFFCIASPSFSQEVYIGPKLGFSVHKARFNFPEQEEFFDQKVRVGYQIGGAFDKPLKNIFHFYTELYFSQKGKKTIIVENGLVNQSKYFFIEAPILLRLQFEGGAAEAGTYNFHFDIGPTLSYWLGGKGTVGLEGFKPYKIVFDKDSADVASDELVIYGANRLQWGLNFGFGIEYPIIKNQSIFVDLRIVFGNSDLIDSSGSSEFDLFGYDDDLHVRFTQVVLSVSYMFTYDWGGRLKGKSTIKNRPTR